MINIYNYSDYRQFLLDFIIENEDARPKLSSRAIAVKAGMDPSLFLKVLKGSRNITPEQALKITRIIGLDKKGSEYFEILVRFCQACSHDTKKLYYEQLLELREVPDFSPLSKEQYEFYNRWYYTVIRDLLHFYPKGDDYKSIAKMLVPKINASQAQQAVALLERLGMIQPKPDGGYELAHTFIAAGSEIQAFAIKRFQVTMMDIAKDALEFFPKEKREISTMTLSLSEEGFEKVTDAIREFRRKLREIADADSNISGVYQVNFQAFPVTHVFRNDGGNNND